MLEFEIVMLQVWIRFLKSFSLFNEVNVELVVKNTFIYCDVLNPNFVLCLGLHLFHGGKKLTQWDS